MSTSASSISGSADAGVRYAVLAGNPNCGKTTLFNALTGLRAKVGNYPGVTVERKEGRLQGAPKDRPVIVLDLPGAYSLSPQSLDEQIARDVLFGRLREVPPPDLVVVVVDASNLQRNLYFATQVIELGFPTVLALNMIDVAAENGHEIDVKQLSCALGVPVFPMTASTDAGVPELRRYLLTTLPNRPKAPATGATPNGPAALPSLAAIHEPGTTDILFSDLPEPFAKELARLAKELDALNPGAPRRARAEACLLISDERFLNSSPNHYPPSILKTITATRQQLDDQGVDWRSAAIEARYSRIAEIQQAVTTETLVERETFSDRLDRLLTHKIGGLVVFLAVMALMFQAIFRFAELPMRGLEAGVGWIGNQVSHLLGPGPLNSLLVDGIIAGVGAVAVFLPQICLLFFFIGLLEDTGYMARAAFLMDRLMSKVGLHGKSFIPLLSSFACAIPGIMATRTIETPKDRLATMLVAPLMSCSARLPVYTLLIAACIPNRAVLGFLRLPGLTMLSMYLLGIVMALLLAWLFKRTLLKGPTPILIMELPPYKRPLLRVVARHMWERAKLFLQRAGTVILGINILLWFLATYPKSDQAVQQLDARRMSLMQSVQVPVRSVAELPKAREAFARRAAKPGGYTRNEARAAAELQLLDQQQTGEGLRGSFAGMLGRAIEPLIAPLGFDWKIGIGIVSSFAAREVFVSTMSLVYNVSDSDDSEQGIKTLAETMRAQTRSNGTPVYSALQGVTLMVFYALALQCVSTIAIMRKETSSWKWPCFQWLYMGALAWLMAFITYQGGRLLGLG